jgi:hypothetical protein
MPATAEQTRYVLDSNVFMESAKRYYAFDIVPGFWVSLIERHGTGEILSVDRVKSEIDDGGGQLAVWAHNDFGHAFVSTSDDDVTTAYSQVIAWVVGNPLYTQGAQTEFAGVADGWLVAFAMARNYTVVTEESIDNSTQTQGRVKIPNVCRAMNVSYCNTFQMLRALGIRF